MSGHLYSFIIGLGSGVYIAQNYDVPEIKILGEKFFEYLKSLEKKNK